MKTLNLAIATLAIVAAASTSAFALGNAPGNGPTRDTNSVVTLNGSDSYTAGPAAAPAKSVTGNDALILNLQAQYDGHQS